MTEDDLGKNESSRASRAAAKGREKLKEVRQLFVSIRQEVAGDQFWRYQRNVSPGLQEYIEALSFVHFLETGKLISFSDVQHSLSDESDGLVCPQYVLSFGYSVDSFAALSASTGRLLAWVVRFDRRTHALCNFCHLAAWGSHKSQRSL